MTNVTPTTEKNYDIIIAGSGVATLSLLYRVMKQGLWLDKRIVIIDRDQKQSNDRTISFWSKTATEFEGSVWKSWDKISFFANNGKKIALNNQPYIYKTIRGQDFYHQCLSFLSKFENITFVINEVTEIKQKNGICKVYAGNELYTAPLLFNSIFKKPILNKEQYFLQHFKGILISADHQIPVNEAYLMDFRTTQENGTSFFYALPINEKQFFVEYTLFSKTVLSEKTYDLKLEEYLQQILKIDNYKILETEFGVIPMTSYRFNRRSGGIFNIGTIGGDTRASTGYTFTNIQKTIDQIIISIKTYGHPFNFNENIGTKEQLYDATLLNVLDQNNYQGHAIFKDLFDGTDAKNVFRFLDAESNFMNDVKIMSSLRVWPFLSSFIKALKHRLYK